MRKSINRFYTKRKRNSIKKKYLTKQRTQQNKNSTKKSNQRGSSTIIDETMNQQYPELENKFIYPPVDNNELQNWDIGNQIGSGNEGAVYLVRSKLQTLENNDEFILKVYPEYSDNFFREVTALTYLKDWHGSPNIYKAWRTDNENGKMGIIIMEKLYVCKLNNKDKYKATLQLLDELHKLNWIHEDTHKNNVMCNKNGDIKLIDFGSAQYFPNNMGYSQTHPKSSYLTYNNPWKWFNQCHKNGINMTELSILEYRKVLQNYILTLEQNDEEITPEIKKEIRDTEDLFNNVVKCKFKSIQKPLKSKLKQPFNNYARIPTDEIPVM